MDIILSNTKGIEIMGRYWHKDSRYYSKDIFNSLQNKTTIEEILRLVELDDESVKIDQKISIYQSI